MDKNSRSVITSAPKRVRQINVEQQLLLAERDDLQESEISYKKRIQKLEHEAEDMLSNYDMLYNENKILRSKLEVTVTSADGVESYNTIFKERQHLKESNRAFKRRIQQLEDDIANAWKANGDLENENKRLQQESGLEKEYATKAKDLEIRELQTSHNTLADKANMLLRERQQLEYRIGQMDKERSELEKRYDMLAIENKEIKIKCEVLENDRVSLKDTISELEKNIIDPEQKAKDEEMFLNLQNQLIALQVSIKDANVEIQDLKEENRILNKLKTEREHMVDRAISVMSNDEELENDRLRELERDEVNSELDDQKRRCGLLLKENDKLKVNVRRLESELEKLFLERKADSNQILQKEKAISEMRGSINFDQGLNEDYDRLQKKYVEAMTQNHMLENKLMEEKHLAKQELQKMRETLQDYDIKMIDDKRKGERYEKDLRNLQFDNDSMEKIIGGQSLELKNMKSQIEQLRSILEEKSSKYEDSKEGVKSAHAELRDTKIELSLVMKELEELKNEHKGKVNKLSVELKAAKEERSVETEHLKKQSQGLNEEVKRLKNFEYKIAMMESEIKKLLNRLRMADRFRKTLRPRPSIVDTDKDEIGEIKKKIGDVETDKMKLMAEKRTWELTKEKYGELQQYNTRLIEENKRLRRDLENSSYKVDNLEKKVRSTNTHTDDVKAYQETQVAIFIDKNPRNKGQRNVMRNDAMIQHADERVDVERLRRYKLPIKESEKTRDIKSTRTSLDVTRIPSKPPVKSNKVAQSSTRLRISSEMAGGRGYSELHKSRYNIKNNTLPLL